MTPEMTPAQHEAQKRLVLASLQLRPPVAVKFVCPAPDTRA